MGIVIILILIIYIGYVIAKEIEYQTKKNYYLKQITINHNRRKIKLHLNEESKEKSKNEIKEKYQEQLKKEKSKFNYQNQYYKKNCILTKTELIFYKQLLNITNKMNLTLLTQIPIYEIVKTKNTIYKGINFNKIRSKSIDFVITTNELQPIICIELDDYSHKRIDRIERDIFVNHLFNDLEIKLLRINVNKIYNFDKIEYYINENFKKNNIVNNF